jgi:hypothetical protein
MPRCTLHKKRVIASTLDTVPYLEYKQDVYRSLCDTIRSNGSNVSAMTALSVTLLSFVEVLEGNFDHASSHVEAVAAMRCLERLGEVEWRIIVWNDFRYAAKTVMLPSLP